MPFVILKNGTEIERGVGRNGDCGGMWKRHRLMATVGICAKNGGQLIRLTPGGGLMMLEAEREGGGGGVVSLSSHVLEVSKLLLLTCPTFQEYEVPPERKAPQACIQIKWLCYFVSKQKQEAYLL